MWIKLLTILFLFTVNCEIIVPQQNQLEDASIWTCVINIIQKYFEEGKELTYVNNLSNITDVILLRIHTLQSITVNTRTPPETIFSVNHVYVILAKDVPEFKEYIVSLTEEPGWNPYARFLVLFRLFERHELKKIFDILLSLHVINVVIFNGATAELYSYNPYDNFACGRYYPEIIEFGKCLNVTKDIYPQKVKTGLRNCLFTVSVAHWPPYGIDPSKVDDGTNIMGTEEYIFHLMSDIMHFSYKFYYNYDPESFSVVSNNMTVTGPLLFLEEGKTDVMMGGLMLLQSRARKFFYVYGHLDNVDEVRVMVKRAMEVPAWKDFYLEFTPTAWVSLLVALTIYSVLMMILIRAKDKGHVVLLMLNNMLSHGSHIRSRWSVQCVYILWVWSAFLLNCYYTTTLMSLTTKPNLDYQIRDEETMSALGLQPCVSIAMDMFRKAESINGDILQDIHVGTKGCEKFIDSIKSVSESDKLFTIILYSVYTYHKHQFYDKYGNSPVYSFAKPYSKVIYAMYFNKGFPMSERLHMLALRIRESGLAENNMKKHYENRKRKYKFRSQGFMTRFAIPWYLYFTGISISSIIFGIELIASQYKDKQIARVKN